jgi:hypothetical protein
MPFRQSLDIHSEIAQYVVRMPPSPQTFPKHVHRNGGHIQGELDTADEVEELLGAPGGHPVIQEDC